MKSAQRLGGCGVMAAVIVTTACVHSAPLRAPIPPPLVRTVTLYGHALRLHLSAGSDEAPLLVFATGDGGWRGKDLDTYRHLVSWGYPVVGFSAPEYIKYLRGEDATTTPLRLATDYAMIVELAKRELKIADAVPVILVGISRGAGLSVAAAGQRVLRDELAGVLVVALTREEEHVRFRRLRRGNASGRPAMLQTYEYLPTLATVPIAVVQSTHDNYLPADRARTLFGPDTPSRRFVAIASRDHSFSDARDELYDAMARMLTWLRPQWVRP